MKILSLHFPVSTSKYSTDFTQTHRHVLYLYFSPMRPRKCVNKCQREAVVSLAYEKSHEEQRGEKKVSVADARTSNTAPNDQSKNN